jgi:hypothetical protein
MITLREWLTRVGQLLDIEVEPNYVVEMPDGHVLRATARIPNFGSENGMLITGNYSEVKSYLDELHDLKYGFCVLSDPTTDADLDRTSIIEMFQDWGWLGAPDRRPSWM